MSSKTLCACGCGKEIKSWCTYHVGHYPRDTAHKILMSDAKLGQELGTPSRSLAGQENISRAQLGRRKGLEELRAVLRNRAIAPTEVKLLDIIERHELPLVYNGRAEHLILGGRVPDFIDIPGQHVVEVSNLEWDPDDLWQLPTIYEAEGWECLILDTEEVKWAFPGESESL